MDRNLPRLADEWTPDDDVAPSRAAYRWATWDPQGFVEHLEDFAAEEEEEQEL